MLDLLICAALAWSDGDSGRCDGRRFRLDGVDAGEVRPFTRCRDRGHVWACSPIAREFGPVAARRVRDLTRDGARCQTAGGSSYGRVVVRCFANGRDVGEVLVREGLAIADPRYGAEYERAEAQARRERRGVWR